MPEIDGGYYIKARKIQESEIAHAPPHVREIWDWLIKEANHKNNGKFKRGQTMRSLKDIQDGLKWYIGYRKMTYSKSNCEMAMNWLRKRGMIETAKTTRGMIITILNYDTYQNPKNYESNSENAMKATTNEQHSDSINKNDKNEKNDKNIYEGFENLNNEPFINAYSEWIGFRKELKKALKPTTITKQLEFLNKQPDPIKCINQSIQNGWQGLFEVKNGTQPEAGNINRTNGLPPVLGKKYKTADLSNP